MKKDFNFRWFLNWLVVFSGFIVMLILSSLIFYNWTDLNSSTILSGKPIFVLEKINFWWFVGMSLWTFLNLLFIFWFCGSIHILFSLLNYFNKRCD